MLGCLAISTFCRTYLYLCIGVCRTFAWRRKLQYLTRFAQHGLLLQRNIFVTYSILKFAAESERLLFLYNVYGLEPFVSLFDIESHLIPFGK